MLENISYTIKMHKFATIATVLAILFEGFAVWSNLSMLATAGTARSVSDGFEISRILWDTGFVIYLIALSWSLAIRRDYEQGESARNICNTILIVLLAGAFVGLVIAGFMSSSITGVH